MTIPAIDRSQQRAARVVGFAYLFAMGTAIFAEFNVHARLIVAGDAAQTAQNIMAHQQLWRLGMASNLLCFLTDVALIVALYVILKRVNPSLALFAASLRLVESSFFIALTLNDFDVLQALSGADYLKTFGADRLQALAMLSIAAHGDRYNAGLVIFGLGSAVFSYLWFQSRYIPKVLAAWGVFSSLLVEAGSFAILISPGFEKVLLQRHFTPIFLFEVIMGFWLLLRGLRPHGWFVPEK